jgi:ABC-type multidrug transport system fused ATPase/permease subunit
MKNLRDLIALLPRRLQWQWAGLLPLILLTAVLEAAAAEGILGLLRVLTDPAPSQTRLSWPLSYLPAGDDWRGAVLTITLVVMAIFACRLVILSVVVALKEQIARTSVVYLSDKVLGAYLEGPFAIVSRRASSDLQHRVERYAEAAVGLGLSALLQVIVEILVVIGLVILLLFTAPLPTLGAVGATAVLLLLPAWLSRGTFTRIAEQHQAVDQQMVHQLRQGLGALREIRVYGREQFFRQRTRSLLDGLFRVQRRRLVLSDIMRLSVETVFVLVLLIAIVLVTSQAETADVISLLGLYAYAGFRFVPSANRITMNLNNVRGALPYARELHQDILTLAPEPTASSADTAPPFARDIEFSDVGYQYADTTVPALTGITLRITKGESIGIVGPSGSGKSTLADLMLGLLTPSVGRILIDGRDLREMRRAWQRHIGYVAQSFYLLDDTVGRNIAFGLDSTAIDERRVREVVKAAHLESLIEMLPDGIDTVIGETGARLSGGERQRVALARALYANPDVLVLDEATAALDPHTEREVTHAIRNLKGTRTLIVIAHRISTVKECDRLIMLSDGRIHATGQFDNLVATNADFRALVAADLHHSHEAPRRS